MFHKRHVGIKRVKPHLSVILILVKKKCGNFFSFCANEGISSCPDFGGITVCTIDLRQTFFANNFLVCVKKQQLWQ
jgi:hypothetical protein